MKYFKIVKHSKKSKARLTLLDTPHGRVHGPFFMPIATRGAVKNLTVDELHELGAEILLSNTYHLLLHPGMDVMKKSKGLHTFMNWNCPILTDSGGYQVFSLSNHREITERGVKFRDPECGKTYVLTPEEAIRIQNIIGSDIIMVLDECPPYPCSRKYAEDSLKMTLRWAKRCKKEFIKAQSLGLRAWGSKPKAQSPLLFGIVQGGVYKDLRIKAARELVTMGFSAQGGPASGWDGYAIGGVAVGEPREKLKKVLEWVMPALPENKPRYLMGLGKPEEIVWAVCRGIDMFDCVIPTREARHGRLYLWQRALGLGQWAQSPKLKAHCFYKTINIKNARYARDLTPINNTNLKQYTKAYLHHLFHTNELLGLRLATLNNLKFYLDLMKRIRRDIKSEIL